MNELFDWKYYVNKYDDLKESGITNYKRAYAHWEKRGKQENRYPNRQFEILDRQNKNQSFLLNPNNRFLKKSIENESSFEDTKSSISLNEKKLEFTNFDNSLNDNNSQLTNNLLTNLNNNLNIIFSEMQIINSKISNLEKLYSDSSSKDNYLVQDVKKKNINDKASNEKNESSKVSIDEKIVSSEEPTNEDLTNGYDDDDDEINEIKYSNSDEYNSDSDNLIESPKNSVISFRSINNNSKIKTINIPVDNIDKKKVKKKVKTNDKNIIDDLIKDSNIKMVPKKKVKKVTKDFETLEDNVSSDVSSEINEKNNNKIAEIQNKSLLKNILANDTTIVDTKEDNTNIEPNINKNKNHIIEYLKTQNIESVPSFEPDKLSKLIKNISSK